MLIGFRLTGKNRHINRTTLPSADADVTTPLRCVTDVPSRVKSRVAISSLTRAGRKLCCVKLPLSGELAAKQTEG